MSKPLTPVPLPLTRSLESVLSVAEADLAQRRIGVLEAFLTAQGFDPAVVNGG